MPSRKKKPDRPGAGRRARVSIISLNDVRTVRSIFRQIAHTAITHQDLRRKIFREIARSPKLQHMILEVLSRHAEAQKNVLQQLAKSPQLKRKLFVIADEQQPS